jgi:hypothetical protein
MKCTYCGSAGLEPGYVRDSGQASQGYGRWVRGVLQRGPLGGAKLMGRQQLPIHALRCPRCAHLELFAAEQA